METCPRRGRDPDKREDVSLTSSTMTDGVNLTEHPCKTWYPSHDSTTIHRSCPPTLVQDRSRPKRTQVPCPYRRQGTSPTQHKSSVTVTPVSHVPPGSLHSTLVLAVVVEDRIKKEVDRRDRDRVPNRLLTAPLHRTDPGVPVNTIGRPREP